MSQSLCLENLDMHLLLFNKKGASILYNISNSLIFKVNVSSRTATEVRFDLIIELSYTSVTLISMCILPVTAIFVDPETPAISNGLRDHVWPLITFAYNHFAYN